jgi:hypothetical protein
MLVLSNIMLTYTPSNPTYYTELDDTPKNLVSILWRIWAKEGLYTYQSRKGKVGVTGPRQSLVALLKESGGGRLFLTKPDGETQNWDILPAIPSASPTSNVSPTRPWGVLSDFKKKEGLGPINKGTPVSPLRKNPLRKNNPVLYWTLRTVWFILKLPFM